MRSLRGSPAFTLTALAALAVGIGANSAIFSVVNAVLLKPAGYPEPDRIVFFSLESDSGSSYNGSATKFNVCRRQTRAFQSVAAYEYAGAQLNLNAGPFPEPVYAIRVSADYFALFGAPMIEGRGFTAEEDRPGGGHVVVISHGLWQRRFGGDAQIIGKSVSLSGVLYTVIGVVGPGFNTELDSAPEAWLPFQIDPNSTDQAQYFSIVGRLRSGVSIAAANAQLQGAAEEFRARFPHIMGPRDFFAVRPFHDAIVGEVRGSLLVFAVAVAFVLLIACANVANLLLVRSTARKREVAIRAAIGAGRAQIVRQMLIESVVLSAAGGALGLALGYIGVRALLAFNPGNIPRIGVNGSAIVLDWRVIVFTCGVSIVTGLLFGILPALNTSRTDLAQALKEGGGRSATGSPQNRTRALLVVGEVSLALVLSVAAALLIRTFVALRAVNPGFDARNVLTMRMSLSNSRFHTTADVNQLIRAGIGNIESLPGVDRAAASYNLPLEGAFGIPFNIVGHVPSSGAYDGRGWIAVSPGYFDVFRIPVIRGRIFNNRDDPGSARVAVISRALSLKFWHEGDPLQDRVILGKGYGPEFEEAARQIVGVAGDVRDAGLDHAPDPLVYLPLAQVADGITSLVTRVSAIAWIVRARIEPHSLISPVENALAQASGGMPVTQVRSMAEVRHQSTARADFNTALLTTFGLSALLLAAIGIFGVMAYSVRQRTQELGIRIALGAQRNDVRNIILWQGMRLAATGIVIGIAASFGLTHLIANLLFGVAAWDPLVFVSVTILLGAVSLLAAWFPAVRAMRIDPMKALRSE